MHKRTELGRLYATSLVAQLMIKSRKLMTGTQCSLQIRKCKQRTTNGKTLDIMNRKTEISIKDLI